jgi:acetate kinase
MENKKQKELMILVLNCGSSSVKYSLFRVIWIDGEKDFALITSGQTECIGQKGSLIKNHRQAIKNVLDVLAHKNFSYRNINAVGHRVVHGGEYFRKPTLINKEVISKIRDCSKLAPLHNPANLAGIEACNELLHRVKQVAVFDTAFHQTIPPRAYLYAIPYRYYKKYHLRKYGFHGMSHQYVAREAAKILGRSLDKLKLITCHLGNGCSISAIRNGQSLDTSMGFTPLAGLVMGTRSGDIDPAAILYIMQREKISPSEMEEMLNKHSGLRGVSGLSNDMRVLLKAAKKGNKRARIALSIFTYNIRKYIGSYIAVMGGVDAVVFTAGIGENMEIKKMISYGGLLSFLDKLNVKFLVIHTKEELMIAHETYKMINKH